ncbi:MAG TPA: hypothetical protein ENK55_08335, partial [Actinobacteria bacterium]|nr:hypothetical protein [Actinomycetota bacterium]
MSRYFIGVDVGGTKTTALVADVEGNVAGIGAARGGNPRSSGAETAEVVAAAAAEALGGIDPSRVAHGVVAVAGGVAGRSAEEQPILRAWSRAGLSAPVTFVPDVLAAFRAGTPARRGAVLVAGTGAVAAVVDGDAVVRRAGGHGWLVGDEGSAVWLGIRGVRAVLHALDGRGPATSLTTAFVEAIGIDADADPEALARALVDHVYAHPPADLGRLARPVVDACAAGDAVASELVRDA